MIYKMIHEKILEILFKYIIKIYLNLIKKEKLLQ
jgi:hypothetical protein